MAREFNVIVERGEGGYYVASVPTLRGCHTQAKSLDELAPRVREALKSCLEVEGDPTERLEFVWVQRALKRPYGTALPYGFRSSRQA